MRLATLGNYGNSDFGGFADQHRQMLSLIVNAQLNARKTADGNCPGACLIREPMNQARAIAISLGLTGVTGILSEIENNYQAYSWEKVATRLFDAKIVAQQARDQGIDARDGATTSSVNNSWTQLQTEAKRLQAPQAQPSAVVSDNGGMGAGAIALIGIGILGVGGLAYYLISKKG